MIRLVNGLILPNAGSYRLFGVDSQDPAIAKVRRRVGAIVGLGAWGYFAFRKKDLK